MLTKLFEAIDSEILTPEMTSSLEESFNNAVEVKAAEMVNEKVQEEKELLIEEYDAKLDEYRKESDDRISEYLDLVVESYLKDNKVQLDESIKAAQVDALLEGFDALLVTGGVDLKNITESTEDSKLQKSVEELSEKVNSLVENNTELKAKNDELLQMGLVSELSEGLTLVKKEKFSELAKVISIDEGFNAYVEKLTLLKETVSKSEKEEVNEGSEQINESDKTDKSAKPSWSKFI